MSGGIGFYVHHHGKGHANRAQQIITHLNRPVTVFGSGLQHFQPPKHNQLRVIALPSDVINPLPEESTWPDVLHYAPLGVPGIQERMFILAQWISQTNPALLVVDVSVEVALFARLMSIPTVVMRQSGIRADLPHRAAYQSSGGLLAPYPSSLEDSATEEWVRKKTFYAGGFSRYAQQTLTTEAARNAIGMKPESLYVVVMNGLGGDGNPLRSIVEAAQASPSWHWWVVGPTTGTYSELPANVRVIGKVDDTFPYLKGADVVVASAGNNTVMEIATAGTPFVCIPEKRPFEEQQSKAEALRSIGAAYVLAEWPPSADWTHLLPQMKHADTLSLAGIVNSRGAQRCAHYIDQLAEQYDSKGHER